MVVLNLGAFTRRGLAVTGLMGGCAAAYGYWNYAGGIWPAEDPAVLPVQVRTRHRACLCMAACRGACGAPTAARKCSMATLQLCRTPSHAW